MRRPRLSTNRYAARRLTGGVVCPSGGKAQIAAGSVRFLESAFFFLIDPGRFANHHGQLVAQVPGLRRYVQNHAIPAAYGLRPMTHDGFSELWFDDVAALQAALASKEAQAVRWDAETLFAEPVGLVIAREQIQKELA